MQQMQPLLYALRMARWKTAAFCFVLPTAILLATGFQGIAAGTKVTFDTNGVAQVNGKPFFPIGVFTYDLTPEVLAEIREVRCNTVLNGFATNQLDLLHEHGLMAVCFTDSPWVQVARDHPALLAWYLADEPEGRFTPAELLKRYQILKQADPDHPIGLCHTSFEALTQFQRDCDFTMTDIYPITARRDKNIMGVSIMMDEARRVHGANWPQWTYIQVFGGPDTDHGVWAVPLPHEVRFMAYQALVHRATGILYFSYWPRQQRTWQSLARLNGEIQQLIPWLVATGTDEASVSGGGGIQMRIRRVPHLNTRKQTAHAAAGLIIAINTSPRFRQV
ncbi:MAG TPA: hypothetical protein VHH88_13890, partial [Verrucomicrobiae bacterium]|nr:hypothetical protein [Verrucomicrobiae bacterium]